jgi:HNH endonuclease
MNHQEPPFKCLYCLKDANEVAFGTVEHVIPESLGNNTKFVLPKGYVCDGCQNYFATGIENRILSHPILAIQRFNSGIPSKKGLPPKYKRDFIEISRNSDGNPIYKFHEEKLKTALRERRVKTINKNGKRRLQETIEMTKKDLAMFTRFLLKMALGMLVLHSPGANPWTNQTYDPYGEGLESARVFARNPKVKDPWSIWIQKLDQEQIIEQKFWEENEFFAVISDGSLIFHYRFGCIFLACNLHNRSFNFYSEILKGKYGGNGYVIQTRI